MYYQRQQAGNKKRGFARSGSEEETRSTGPPLYYTHIGWGWEGRRWVPYSLQYYLVIKKKYGQMLFNQVYQNLLTPTPIFVLHSLQLLVYRNMNAFFLIILPILLSILRSVVWCCSMLIISIVGRQFGPLWSMVHSIVSTDTATDSPVELRRGSFRTLLQILYNWLLGMMWCA